MNQTENSTGVGFELDRFRLAICLGPGGVGKTTVSAALAVQAALSGRAVDVMTVDPAPRLLDALGLDGDASEPREIPLGAVSKSSAQSSPRFSARSSSHSSLRGSRRSSALISKRSPGCLRALRLDAKSTFDAIVRRYAPTSAAADAIMSGRIYRNLSAALAGVADYMAIEKLLELEADSTAGLMVLDTPPAAEALNFLDAPRRLLDLLGSRAVTLLGAPAGMLRGSIVDIAARAVLTAFDRITGLRLLSDVQEFVRSFEGMYEGFAERAAHANAMLRAEDTAALVVTTAETGPVSQACEFVAALARAGMRVRAVIVNRAMPPLPDPKQVERSILADPLKRKLLRNLADYAALKDREAASFDTLRAAMPPDASLMLTPDLGREPRTLADLAQIGASLRPAAPSAASDS